MKRTFVAVLALATFFFAAGCTLNTPYESMSSAPLSVQTPVSQTLLEPYYHVLAPARANVYHTVGPMETLWRISKIYGVDQQLIMQANHLRDPSKLAVGQKLLIPNAASPRSVVPLYNTRPWEYIVIHHTATDNGNAITINQIHHARGFDHGLGYHFLIDNGTSDKNVGQIEVGPRWVKQMDGAHCNAAGMNEHGIGIALVGNYSENYVPEEMLESLATLVNILRYHYNIPIDHILRHDDVPGKNTECPGTHFPWQEFLTRLRNLPPPVFSAKQS